MSIKIDPRPWAKPSKTPRIKRLFDNFKLGIVCPDGILSGKTVGSANSAGKVRFRNRLWHRKKISVYQRFKDKRAKRVCQENMVRFGHSGGGAGT
jgi:hypothetical protein